MARNAHNPHDVSDTPLFGGNPVPAPTYVSTQAAKARDAAIAALARNAGEEFIRRAGEFVVEHLRTFGPKTSEQLTDACLAAGIRPHDTKAFGAVYGGLARRGKIVKAGSRPREKGHGSGLTWLWKCA